jgi:cell division protein FtsB
MVGKAEKKNNITMEIAPIWKFFFGIWSHFAARMVRMGAARVWVE